jgi:hypothetical protein
MQIKETILYYFRKHNIIAKKREYSRKKNLQRFSQMFTERFAYNKKSAALINLMRNLFNCKQDQYCFIKIHQFVACYTQT